MRPVLLLLALTLLRWIVAASVPLSPDEAYYWVWSRALQPGYLDHPPMVALWIRLGTALAGDTALGVRLLAPLAAALGSLMLADAANRLYPAHRPGVAAAAVLNATLMLGAGAVTMTPDTPLLFFAVAVLWTMARVADPRWWIAVGLALGAALASKYTGALLAAGPAFWLAQRPHRAALRTPYPWIGAALAALVFAPVVAWNAAHGWASFIKQGGRTTAWQPQAAVQHLLELVGGQIGLATPLIFALFALGLWRTLAAARRSPADLLLASLCVPGLLIFVEHALGARVQANWLAILYPPLAIAAAVPPIRWRGAAIALGAGLTAVVYLQATAAPFPLPRQADPTLIQLAGWDTLAAAADQRRRAAGLAFLASEDYGQAAELAWWSPPGTSVIGAEPRWRLFELAAAPASTGLLLISERRRDGPDPALWNDPVELEGLTRARAGVEADRFRVYRVTLRTDAPAVLLPRPGGE